MSKLRNKIAISFAILALIISGAISIGLYTYTSIQARETTRIRLMDIAITASQLIDADLHNTLTDFEQMDSPDYLRVRNELDNLLLNNPNILYAYTMRSHDDEVIFVVDSIVGEGEPADLGEIYDEAEQVFSDYVATASEPWADEDFTTDEWGTVLSGYAPLFTSDGKLDGIIGIDMHVNDVHAYENQFLWISLIFFLVSVPIALVTGWLVGNRLSKPLDALTNDVQRMASGDLSHRAQITTQDEFANLATSFNHMTAQVQFLISELEDRVAHRTRELEERTRYLEATTQVSQATTGILDTEDLIKEVVEQIRRRFKLYYVGLFLVNPNKEWADLHAGTGGAGRKMLERGHRIKIGSGMIGWSIQNAKPRVAQIAQDDSVRLEIKELADTRSEAALPLRSRGQVLGAISVQSDQPEAFDIQIISVLQTMADQIAIAIDNAILFTQSQAALEAERRTLGRMGRESWETFLLDQSGRGYKTIGDELITAGGEWDRTMIDAARFKQAVHDQKGNLAVPIKVRNEVIGVLRFYKDPQNNGRQIWSNEEIKLLESILDQVGQAVESARLYQETQRREAFERVSGDITAHMRSSLDMETVLRSAIQEIGERVGATQVKVHLGNLNIET